MEITMIKVQRANVILSIRSDEKEEYMQKGYSVIDDTTGKIIEEAISNDVNFLQKQVKEYRKTISAKDAEIKKLKSEITKLKKA